MTSRVRASRVRAFFGYAGWLAVLAAVTTWTCSGRARADEALRRKLVARAVTYLAHQGQAPDGSFSASAGPAVTALVATALLRNGRPVDDPVVAKAIAYVERFVRPDGGIHAKGSRYRNYETAVALQMFVQANQDGRYDGLIKKATAFLKGIQWDEGEGKDRSDFAYGGAGYGKHRRPDLSNTSFFIEALREAGVPKDDPAIQRALLFVSRCQNLESEYNRTPYAAKNPDGGFYYTPAPGQSQAGTTPTGGLRSYASMTYAGLKSMIYAGVGPDDPRVKAAVTWIRKHYDLRSNPGLGKAGLYYYYHTFAKALDALGVDVIEDADGKKHNWRKELIQELARRQQPSGCWVNDNRRWLEGDPNLVTAYALLALAYCQPKPSAPSSR